MPIKYIGKTVFYKGKTLWEIVGNLKNLGIGRIVVRSSFERYPEPSFLKIMKVETLPNPETNTPDDVRKVRVWVEKTFRGRKHPELVRVERVSYKTDYRLLAKDEEEAYCKCDNPRVETKILPMSMNFPPLLRELIVRELKAKGGDVNDGPQMKVVYKDGRDSYYRAADESEVPTAEVTTFGKPVAPHLYKDIDV